MCRPLLVKLFIVLSLTAVSAEAQQTKSADTKVSKVLGGQLSTILQFGLAGGALGLSTLSFFGRPQDKLSYIPLGMALGIITGTIYSTSEVVSDPSGTISQVPPCIRWTYNF